MAGEVVAFEEVWQPGPKAFTLQEISHALATHEIDSRRTATKPARMALKRMKRMLLHFSKWMFVVSGKL